MGKIAEDFQKHVEDKYMKDLIPTNSKVGVEVKEDTERKDDTPGTYNTGIEMKNANFDAFFCLIRNQFQHGGSKYSLDGQPDKEFTDLVCEVAPGRSGVDWIMQTIVKYCGRFINFQREKDLLKIATYCYIAWLKKGFHLQQNHDEDTKKEG